MAGREGFGLGRSPDPYVQLNAKDEVHAAGIQAGLTFVLWKAALTFRYQWEFDAEARFEGNNLVVTLAKGF